MQNSILEVLIQLCFPGILGFIFLTAFIVADKTFPDKILRLTMCALISGFVFMLTDSVNYYFEAQQTHTRLRLYMLALSFSSKIFCSSFCVALSQRKFPKSSLIIHVFMTINAVLSFISIPTGCIFYIKPDFSVGHGTLYFVPYIFILYNCIRLMYSGIREFRTNRGETVICLAMVVFPFIATYLEVKHHYMLMLPLAFLICIIFYFMCLNVQLYRRDTLTHLLNRRSFFLDAIRHAKKHIYIVSMDLNDLKYYNDSFGHNEGDKAITTASHIMELAFSHYGIVYRTGGDEFMALFINKRKESVDDCMLTFKLMMEKTDYRVACGVAEYKPGDDFESIVGESDARMYRDKIAYKEMRAKQAEERLKAKELEELYSEDE